MRLFTYGLTCASLLVFRRQRPGQPPGFRAPAGALLAWVGSAFCLWLLLFWLSERTKDLAHAWLLATILAAGAILWWGVRRTRA